MNSSDEPGSVHVASATLADVEPRLPARWKNVRLHRRNQGSPRERVRCLAAGQERREQQEDVS
jgi:hypothetical protein